MKHPDTRSRLIGFLPSLLLACGAAQAIERVKAGDAGLDCAGIAAESQAMDGFIAAGATTEKNAAPGSGGLFGALGAMVSKATQQPAEEKAPPDAAAQQKAAQAQARKSFLARLGTAKECQSGGRGAKQLSEEQFQQIANDAPVPLTAAAIQPALSLPVTLLSADGLVEGKLDMKGKRFYVAEFRVLFDVGGQVSANTRGSYLPGRDYGSTRAKVNYSVPQIDVAAFQAITDKAWEDFKARVAAAGVTLEEREAFERENGAVYEATEEASKPGKPVFIEKNYGHSERKFLVMAPSGMKLHSRGFAGLGAGNIGKRIEWSKSNLEALSISVAVNIAALESSGSGLTMVKRESSASAGEGMSISMAPDTLLVQSHAQTNILRMNAPLAVDGSFASFREVGGYDTDKDAVGRTMGLLTNLAGMGANKTKRTDTEVDLDGPATVRMALQGLATINQAIADRIKAGM
ncbi:MAG TPA: hypothetical protein VEB70_01830 [Noviherbaspirillum sp.]|nr:hypothetical protein [Noviherbaspirillum sp.]